MEIIFDGNEIIQLLFLRIIRFRNGSVNYHLTTWLNCGLTSRVKNDTVKPYNTLKNQSTLVRMGEKVMSLDDLCIVA